MKVSEDKAPPKDVVGDFFSFSVMLEPERARIVETLKDGCLAFDILKKYAPRTEEYLTKFIKKEKINGFTPGRPGYDQKAIPIIIKHLRDSTQGFRHRAWKIYEESVVEYTQRELPLLHKLLIEVPWPSGDATSEVMLKTVCSNAFEYGVEKEDVEKLYELCWIKRVSDINDYLPLCLIPDEKFAAKRKLEKIESSIASLSESLSENIPKIEELINDFENFSGSISKEKEVTKETVERVSNLSKQFKTLESALSQQNNSFSERLKIISDKVKTVENGIESFVTESELRDNLKKLVDDVKTSTQKSLDNAISELNKTVRNEIASSVNDSEIKIVREIGSKGAGKNTEGVIAQKYKSPLLYPSTFVPPSYKITNELEFVSVWSSFLLREKSISISFEQAMIYHSMFLANRVIICDGILAQSWIECMAWKSQVVHVAASPTWSSEEDWSVGAEHLFLDCKQFIPKILFIHNYDVAVAECYLVPSLVLWATKDENKYFSKIFLISSTQESAKSHQVLEYALHLGADDCSMTRSLSIKSGFRIPNSQRSETLSGVDPKVASNWMKPAVKVGYDFSAAQKKFGFTVPETLLNCFERTASSVSKHFDESVGRGVALHHQLYPWIRAKYGESVYGELGAYLRQFQDFKY